MNKKRAKKKKLFDDFGAIPVMCNWKVQSKGSTHPVLISGPKFFEIPPANIKYIYK